MGESTETESGLVVARGYRQGKMGSDCLVAGAYWEKTRQLMVR